MAIDINRDVDVLDTLRALVDVAIEISVTPPVSSPRSLDLLDPVRGKIDQVWDVPGTDFVGFGFTSDDRKGWTWPGIERVEEIRRGYRLHYSNMHNEWGYVDCIVIEEG